jgi:hypothetical protein
MMQVAQVGIRARLLYCAMAAAAANVNQLHDSLATCIPVPDHVIPVAVDAVLAEVEAAVQAVKSVETLEIMGKLLYNCAVSPREEKYRRVKLTNKKVAETIGATHGEASNAHMVVQLQRIAVVKVVGYCRRAFAGQCGNGLVWLSILAPGVTGVSLLQSI